MRGVQQKKYKESILIKMTIAEKISNVFRIAIKVFVSLVTLSVFFIAINYWLERMIYASLPLLTVSALSYYCVIKDHSEDFWKRKFDDEPLAKNICMITLYLITLIVIIFGIAISAHLK